MVHLYFGFVLKYYPDKILDFALALHEAFEADMLHNFQVKERLKQLRKHP